MQWSYRKDWKVEVQKERESGVEVGMEAGAERAYFEPERIEPCLLGFHFYRLFQPCLLIGLQVVEHYRLAAWRRPKASVLGQSSWTSCWGSCVSREDQVDKSEQLGLVQRHSHAVNQADA